MFNHYETRCSQLHKHPGPVEKSSTKSGDKCDVILGSVCSCGEYFDLILSYKLVLSKKLKNVTDYRPLHCGIKFHPTRPFTLQNQGGLFRANQNQLNVKKIGKAPSLSTEHRAQIATLTFNR